MKKDHPLLYMGRSTFYGKWVIGSQNGREVGASPPLQPFFLLYFLLGNQVTRFFHLKDRLIILRAVSCEVCGRISFQVARNQPRTHWSDEDVDVHKLDFRPRSMFM